MTEEVQWLRDYAAKRSDDAFRRLVDRYVNLVYSSARRQVGEEELARDVTQAVFLILAEKAGELNADKPLSAWLMQVTQYASANAVRSRLRRTRHETKAAEMNQEARGEAEWESMSPLLDEGMSKLRSGDRDVLLLRYFEQKTAREVAQAMGISESAAEKRVTRAVERLRDFFRRRGVAVSSGVLAAGLMAHSAEAAPMELSAGISAAGATGGAAGVAKGTVIAMAAAKTKVLVASVVIGVLVVGGGSAAVVTILKSPASSVVKVPTPTNVRATAPGATPWTVIFNDGTRVDLVGITNTPGKTKGWWRGDGSPAPMITTPPPMIGKFDVPNQTTYQFYLRQYLTGARDAQVTPHLTTSTGGSATTTVRKEATSGDVNLMASVASSIQSVDIALTWASGPWRTDWRYDLKEPRDPAATQPADIIIEKVYAEPGKTVIEMRGNGRTEEDRQVQFCVVNAKGKEFGVTTISSMLAGRGTYEFDTPLQDVVALIRRSRPIEIRHVRNLPLHPPATQPATP